MPTRRSWIQFASIFIASSALFTRVIAQNKPKTALLPWPQNMAELAAKANKMGQPWVLLVSLPGCPWCQLLRRNYLVPMQKEGLHAFEIPLNERHLQILDFQARRLTPAAFCASLNITAAPTVLFFNAQGQEIAPRIEGVASADMLGAILDDRLTRARLALHHQPHASLQKSSSGLKNISMD